MIASLNKVDTFLLDLDGTFYLGDRLLPNSLRFLDKLAELRKDFIFVTNNSSKSVDYYVKKLNTMGVPINQKHVFTSGQATAYYLKTKKLFPRICLIGTSDLEQEFLAEGFDLTADQPQAVVLGFDLTLTYEKLSLLCTLVRKGVPFIATHPDLNCPTPQGPIPDCGSIIAAVTAATGIKPKVIGKPHPEMVEAFCQQYKLKPENLAMIGDRLYTDIAMGNAAGILSILVLSGEAGLEDLKESKFKPDIVAEDLGEVADWLDLL